MKFCLMTMEIFLSCCLIFTSVTWIAYSFVNRFYMSSQFSWICSFKITLKTGMVFTFMNGLYVSIKMMLLPESWKATVDIVFCFLFPALTWLIVSFFGVINVLVTVSLLKYFSPTDSLSKYVWSTVSLLKYVQPIVSLSLSFLKLPFKVILLSSDE